MSDWTPAFPDQRPPLQPGHTLSLRHGSYSPRVIGKRARALHRVMVKGRPDLAHLWPELVSELAHVAARLELLRGALDDEKTSGRDTLLKHLNTTEGQYLRLLEALGLTPSSLSRIQRDVAHAEVLAHDLPGLRAEGRRHIPQHIRGDVESRSDDS